MGTSIAALWKAGIGTILVATACAALQDAATARTASWRGHYRYAHDAGRTAGGSPILVTYELTLAQAGGRSTCRTASRGFQTDEVLVCRARNDDDGRTLAIDFLRYPNGGFLNRHGVAVYRPGQTLFSLRRAPDGRLTTRWQAQKPDPETRAEGVYFRKAR